MHPTTSVGIVTVYVTISKSGTCQDIYPQSQSFFEYHQFDMEYEVNFLPLDAQISLSSIKNVYRYKLSEYLFSRQRLMERKGLSHSIPKFCRPKRFRSNLLTEKLSTPSQLIHSGHAKTLTALCLDWKQNKNV